MSGFFSFAYLLIAIRNLTLYSVTVLVHVHVQSCLILFSANLHSTLYNYTVSSLVLAFQLTDRESDLNI